MEQEQRNLAELSSMSQHLASLESYQRQQLDAFEGNEYFLS